MTLKSLYQVLDNFDAYIDGNGRRRCRSLRLHFFIAIGYSVSICGDCRRLGDCRRRYSLSS